MPDNQTVMFCIGAQKAGTTWLERQLEAEERVFFAKPKELHYWDCIRAPYLEQFKLRAKQRLHVPTAEDSLRYRLSRFWRPELQARISLADRYAKIYDAGPYDHSSYLSYLGLNVSDARLIGDITPSYALLSSSTYAEMHACSSDTKFVFIMRDPVQRLWSGVHQSFRQEILDGTFSETDLYRLFEGVCSDPLDPNFRRSDYAQTIAQLEAGVPASSIHYCFYETLLDQENGSGEREALAEFLKISPACLDATHKVHAAGRSYTLTAELAASARRALDPVYASLSDKFGDRLPKAWDL